MEVFEHFSRYVAFEGTDDLSDRFAFFGSSFHVAFGVGVGTEPADDDLVEGVVGLAVAAPVEPVTHYLARGGGERCHPA